MNKAAFTVKAPGRLVEITTPSGKDWAFIPDELPLKWQFDARLWPLLVEARESLGTLNGIGQTLADPQLLLRPLQNREAITSSKIEGTYITAQQLLLFELNPTDGKPSDRAQDWLEVHNYRRALVHSCEQLKNIPLCARLIKSAHGILMGGTRGRDKDPGEFRKYQVQIGHSGRFVPPPAPEIDRLIGNLEIYLNKDYPNVDRLVGCFIVHYQFETIHPFADGNGRIGRLLLALMVYKWLGHKWPWLYMSAFFEKFKDEYTEGLYHVSVDGAFSEWIEFCLRGTIQQANDAIKRCHTFNRLKTEFHAKIDTPSPRTFQIIESLFIDPFVRVSSLAEKFKVSYPTARTDVDMLIEKGILKELTKTRPKTFYSPEIFTAAYSEEISD